MANIGYAIALTAVSLRAEPPPVPILSRTDWLAHGLAYGLQVVILHELFKRLTGSRAAIGISVISAVAFGSVLEFLQLLQPLRFFEGSDLVANGVGAIAAALVLVIVRVARNRRIPEGAP